MPAAQRFRTSDGLQIASHEWGEGGSAPPVVLHHGFVVDAADPRFAASIVEFLG